MDGGRQSPEAGFVKPSFYLLSRWCAEDAARLLEARSRLLAEFSAARESTLDDAVDTEMAGFFKAYAERDFAGAMERLGNCSRILDEAMSRLRGETDEAEALRRVDEMRRAAESCGRVGAGLDDAGMGDSNP